MRDCLIPGNKTCKMEGLLGDFLKGKKGRNFLQGSSLTMSL